MVRGKDDPFALLNEYELRHLPEHLEEVGNLEDLRTLLACEDGARRNGWYEAKHSLGDTAGFLLDAERAWRLSRRTCDREAGPSFGRNLEDDCRYALIRASVNSLDRDLPVQLLASMLEKKMLTPQEAFSYATHMADPQQRARAIARMAPDFYESMPTEALEVARQFDNQSARAIAEAGLIQCLPAAAKESLLEDAMNTAKGIHDSREQARILAQLGTSFVTSGFPQRALDAAEAIRDRELSDQAAAELAPLLASGGHHELALVAARIAGFDKHRAKALISIAPFLPEAYLGGALDIAVDMGRVAWPYGRAYLVRNEGEWGFVDAVAGLLPYLGRGTIRRGLQCVSAMPETGRRSEEESAWINPRAVALSKLAPHVPLSLSEFLLKLTPILPVPNLVWHSAEMLAARVDHWRSYRRRRSLLRVVALQVESTENNQQRYERLRNGIRQLIDLDLATEAWEWALTIKEEWVRVAALIELVPFAGAESVRDIFALQLFPTLYERHQTLLTTAIVRLAELGLQNEAIEFVRKAGTETRIAVLPLLASRLASDYLPQIMEIVQGLEPPNQRVQVLEEICPLLPSALLQAAFDQARVIDDRSIADEVCRVLESGNWQTGNGPSPQVLVSVDSEAGQAMPSREDTKGLSLPDLKSGGDSIENATAKALALLDSIRRNHWGESEIPSMIQGLPEEAKPMVLRKALDLAGILISDRGSYELLEELIPYLPEEMLREAIEDVKGTVSMEEGPTNIKYGYQTLSMMLPRLAEVGHYQEALDEIGGLPIVGPRFSPRNEGFRLAAIGLAKAGFAMEAIAAAGRIDNDRYRWVSDDPSGSASNGLLGLPGILLESGHPREALELVKAIQLGKRRSGLLAELAPLLCESVGVDQGIEAVLAIDSAPQVAEALDKMVPFLLAQPQQSAYAAWLKLVLGLTRRRDNLLLSLKALAPLVVALGGQQTAAQIVDAIRDVSRWWP